MMTPGTCLAMMTPTCLAMTPTCLAMMTPGTCQSGHPTSRSSQLHDMRMERQVGSRGSVG